MVRTKEIDNIPIKYNKISYEDRVSFIQEVITQKNTLKKSCHIYNIKDPTRKAIMKRFYKEGKVNHKKYKDYETEDFYQFNNIK